MFKFLRKNKNTQINKRIIEEYFNIFKNKPINIKTIETLKNEYKIYCYVYDGINNSKLQDFIIKKKEIEETLKDKKFLHYLSDIGIQL